jgi:hypothetical protein
MSVNITLRIPNDLAPLLDQAAGHDGLSRHAWIIQTLTEAVAPDGFDPGLVIGFVMLTGGELHDVDCPECGQPMRDPRIGFVAGKYRPLAFGPVCGFCATTD